MHNAKFGDSFRTNVLRKQSMGHAVLIHGLWRFEHRSKEGELLWTGEGRNLIVNQGLAFFLRTCLTGEDTKPTNWFVGVSNNMTANAPTANDDMSSKAWAEEQQYVAGTRPVCTFANVATKGTSTDNSASPASFESTQDAVTFDGGFLVESAVKGSTSASDVLLNAKAFPSPRVLNTGEVINVTVQLDATSA